MQRTKVGELMTRNVILVQRDADVHELSKVFLDKGVHGVPVVDDDGRLVGVVSQTDLIAWHHDVGLDSSAFYDMPDLRPEAGTRPELLLEDEENLEEADTELGEDEPWPLRPADIRTARVEEVMTPLVHAIGPEQSAADAAARMLRHRIHRLIVVDDELRVLGIVSAMDLLRVCPGVETADEPGAGV
jgi:CBS domain-containing protein